jgi:cold shock protein
MEKSLTDHFLALGRDSKPRARRKEKSVMSDTNVEQSKMIDGTVRWYNPQKFYGFIERSDGAEDCFIHQTALTRANIDTLKEGDRVRFDTEIDRKTNKIKVRNIELIVWNTRPAIQPPLGSPSSGISPELSWLGHGITPLSRRRPGQQQNTEQQFRWKGEHESRQRRRLW